VISPGTVSTAASAPSGGDAAGDDVRLPSFGGFAAVSAIANAPLTALLLLRGDIKAAVNVVVGLAIGLLVYGSIHLFINRGLDFFVPSSRQARPESGLAAVCFGLLLPLKFVFIFAAIYWLLKVHMVILFWMAAGFAVTQLAVIAKTVKRLKSMPLG
jgi:hypothetical protein